MTDSDSRFLEIAGALGASRSRCQRHRKRESQHHVSRLPLVNCVPVSLGPHPFFAGRLSDLADLGFVEARPAFLQCG
jgi:hypothetical protein